MEFNFNQKLQKALPNIFIDFIKNVLKKIVFYTYNFNLKKIRGKKIQ